MLGYGTPLLDTQGRTRGAVHVLVDITERKRAEDELRESRAKLEAALASMTDAVFISDAAGQFIDFNDAFASFHRFRNKAECAKTFAEYPDILDVFMANGELAPLEMWAVPRALRGETVSNAVYTLRRKDTGETWVGSYSFSPIRDKDGLIVGSVVVGRDITEHKRAEEAIRNRERDLARAQATAHLGNWRWDLVSDVVLWSEELYRIFGVNPETFVPSNDAARSMIHPDDLDMHAELIAVALTGKAVEPFEFRILRPNGEERFTLASGFDVEFDDSGKLKAVFGTVLDITDRKLMEEALRKAKDELEERVKVRTYELYTESLYARSLIEASLDPLVTISIDGKITDVNRASEEVTGASREQLIGSDFSDYFTEPKRARAGYEQVFRQGFVRDYPLELKRRDGHVTPVLYNASVYRDDMGRNMGVFAAARDITERKEAETALRRLASELVMAEERERKRIAGVLHDDIAQILAAAKMRLDLLYSIPCDQKDQKTLKQAKELLLQSLQETRALMNDLGNPVLFDMGLRAACESLANQLMQRTPLRIRCDIQDAYKDLNPDVKTILYQVIRELLSNVAKHSQAQSAQVLIDMEDGHFRVKVRDDGVGFKPQVLGTPTLEGGFGLYSIRERLVAVGGSLRIESAPGTGTVVTAIVPATLD